jgi:hypothetical protein
MKTKFAVALCCLAVCGISSSQTTQTQEQEIDRFVQRYDEAWNQKDTASIERILAPEYVYFSSKGEVRSRQSLLDELLSPKYILASADRSEMRVYLTLGTAVVSSRWKGHGTYEGREFRDDQRCSIVLAQPSKGKEWLVLSEHCTQIVAP